MEEHLKIGGVPFGYYFNSSSKTIEMNPKELWIIQKIFELALDGKGPLLIANELNSRMLFGRSKKPWSANTLYKILQPSRLRFYRGFDENGLKGNWTPLLTEEEYTKIIDIRSKYKIKADKEIIHRKEKEIFLLTNIGVFYCGYCKGKIKSSVTGKGENKKRYYYCGTRQTHGSSSCIHSKLIKMDIIDRILLEDLDNRLSTKQIELIHSYRDKVYCLMQDEINKIQSKVHVQNKFLLPEERLESVKRITADIEKVNSILAEMNNMKSPDASKELSRHERIKNNIERVFLYNYNLEIIYHYPINEKLEHLVNIHFDKD